MKVKQNLSMLQIKSLMKQCGFSRDYQTAIKDYFAKAL